MNSFFSFRQCPSIYSSFLLASLMFCLKSQAISLNSIYTSACTRDIGLVVQVSDHSLGFLSLDGKLKEIPKHEVIYLAAYPTDILPMSQFKNPGELELYRIFSLSLKGKLTEIVKGWPIGFTDDKLAFLESNGQESVLSRRSLFKITKERVTVPQRFSQSIDFRQYRFIHPYQFRDCPKDEFAKGRVEIFPQQILSQPIAIKREFDHFQ
ncbi:MAG: hypothetical protein KDD35_00700, partial [Bdellovibrionales bacterium]|nr:hypothetical protein [Bdellovibrionales bacterium]